MENTQTKISGFNWKSLGVILAILGMVLPWIWQAARYPDRTEFNEVKQEFRASEKELSKELRHIGAEQRVIKNDIGYIRDSQKRIEDSLTDALNSRHTATMRGRTSR